ncbi:MAG: methylenetetrahydrofolate reductase C-terminal domain-containing protein [Deltaproteobacteria bacterium]|nr:methylenetetrahydrofolate reductase C-terminal domain-containing protein [Deltaproteobacteria bacterium]
MIITKNKDINAIIKSLEGRKKIYLFGCKSCAEQCHTGGEAELKEMSASLEERGFTVTGHSLVPETCYRQYALKEYKNAACKTSDAVLVLACGAGVRTVADAADESQPVLPALDSIFLATVERQGRFFEGCSLCAECVLADTGSICPHTDCPKGLLNGPCGGVADGMCEVNVENECAWVRIYERLKKQDRLHLMKKTAPPKDHSLSVKPRRVLLRNPVGAVPASKKKGSRP